ncbi:MAG: AGE family epimerase/isomerase [Salinisphaera sp.]|jgi:sulfoquinovose isomerase|nr:AGE family epimerase/isomerase [Salinisphaera sp.]
MSDDTRPAKAFDWLNRASHQHWLESESQRLLDFYRASRRAHGGFGALDADGVLPVDAPADTMITARMTHCYAMAAMQGVPGARGLALHGVEALAGDLRDATHGGWFSQWPLNAEQIDTGDDSKAAYIQVFVALAVSSAALASIEGAGDLLAEAVNVIETHYWDAQTAALRESFSVDWQTEEAYRGGNSNMHGVEAFLQLADVLGDNHWRERALAIVERLIHRHAADQAYLVVEHFDSDWQPWRNYNVDQPAHDFRPYGLTPGHAFEWSRLLLHLEAGLQAHHHDAPDWLLDDARGLFAAATRYGWHVDGRPGLVYTVDWDKQPHVGRRRHWTVAEASAAAAALYQRTGEAEYSRWYEVFWDFIGEHHIDRQNGSWRQELEADNTPCKDALSAKPDLYHAWQATWMPRLPLTPTIASAIAENLTRQN